MKDDLEIIDVHTHLQRDYLHGNELRDYFLPVEVLAPETPNLGTLEEFKDMMSETGIIHANFLMFTWAGKYYRDGQFVIPDDPKHMEQAETNLRRRVSRRIIDNNEWAVRTINHNPQLSFFAGIDPVVMEPDAMMKEIGDKVHRGARGVSIVPGDIGISGGDRLLFPAYEYCAANNIPVLSSADSSSPYANPTAFKPAFQNFPGLKIIFSHMMNCPESGRETDQEVLELSRSYDGVYTDTSMRLTDVADGVIRPEDMVRQIRAIGTDRVMFGSNYVFSDLLRKSRHHQPAPSWVDRRFTQVWKSVQVLKTLPLTDAEREKIASKNFRTVTGQTLSAPVRCQGLDSDINCQITPCPTHFMLSQHSSETKVP